MNRLLAATIALFLPMFLFCGCSSPTDGGDDEDIAPARTSPAGTIARLVWAYDHMDAETYLDCLSEDFIFFLNPEDVEEDPGLEPGYWNKAEERTIHEAMFGDPGERAADIVQLTLTQVGDPTPVEVSPGVFRWQYTESVDLRVYVGELIYLATNPVRFEFREDEDQTGPGGETLWEMSAWHDLGEGGGRVPRHEMSWGTIKAAFR